MQVEIFAIADAATDSLGKLNILGAFDTMFTEKLPLVYPLCAVVAKIRAYKGEASHHTIGIRFLDEHKNEVMKSFQSEFSVNFLSFANFASANIIMYIQGLKLDAFGEYKIELVIDGNSMVTIPLLVAQPTS